MIKITNKSKGFLLFTLLLFTFIFATGCDELLDLVQQPQTEPVMGESIFASQPESTTTPRPTPTPGTSPELTPEAQPITDETNNDWAASSGDRIVWTANRTSEVIHNSRECSNMSRPVETTIADALARSGGGRPCATCWINIPTPVATPEPTATPTQAAADPMMRTVWFAGSGTSIYHSINNCGNMNPRNASSRTRQSAQDIGARACLRCW